MKITSIIFLVASGTNKYFSILAKLSRSSIVSIYVCGLLIVIDRISPETGLEV